MKKKKEQTKNSCHTPISNNMKVARLLWHVTSPPPPSPLPTYRDI